MTKWQYKATYDMCWYVYTCWKYMNIRQQLYIYIYRYVHHYIYIILCLMWFKYGDVWSSFSELESLFTGMLELHCIKTYATRCHIILSFAFNLVHFRHLATGGWHMEHCPMCRTPSTSFRMYISQITSLRVIKPFLQSYFDFDAL